jgi:hypothetical protein
VRDRVPPPPPRIIGEARVRPEHARRELGLDPRAWYPVLERNPEDLHVWARHFHLRTEESRE